MAGGGQEYSLHRWRWLIAHRAVDIVQPDLHYGGGRADRDAADVRRRLGHVDVVQFASFTPNIGPSMEFKGNTDLTVTCATSSLK
ncbi:MAG TPA: hypothetical protein PKE47_09895 [Verrucomicrobiota bacterium]|mgnify:CR=1 FL=1|nr:hypothetical protein [Verrucomicrobiota bacterium]